MSGHLDPGTIDIGQGVAKPGRVGQQGKPGASEDTGEPVLPVGKYDHAEDSVTCVAGVAHGHLAVFDALRALVMVQIVGLAVLQN